MFGIGLGEILIIILVTFLVAPREIPRVMRKLGQLFAALARIRDEIAGLEQDVRGIVEEELPKQEELFPGAQRNRWKPVSRRPGRAAPMKKKRPPSPGRRPRPAPVRKETPPPRSAAGTSPREPK